MSIVRLAGFAGENRAQHAKLLPDSVGTVSRNQKPGRGDLRPWRNPSLVASVPAGGKTIYRMGRDVASDSLYWLSWATVVHAVRGFDATDTTERTYYTGDGAPKVTDNTIALAATPYPTASRPLGIPAPATACTVTPDTGAWTGLVETYFYTYTYVNDWGWESAPAPVSATVTKATDATAAITAFAAAPAGNYNINRIRIYRTQAGSSGSADFFFLREIAYGTVSTSDDTRALGDVLATATWLTPPADLSNLTSLWNGMLAGISGNSVRFCKAYVPYAWPIAYDVVPPDSKPVALGAFGQSLLVLTTGRPLLVAGSGPDSMDQRPLEIPQACVSPPSAVSLGNGVAWSSEDGLCWFGNDGARILTAGLMLREDWQALVPSSIIGKNYEGLYLGSYDDGTGRKGFLIDPMNPTGLYFLDIGYTAMHFDKLRDHLYVLDAGSVKKWDVDVTMMTTRFKSKQFKMPKVTNFSCAEVVADAYPVTLRMDALELPAATVTALVAARPTVFSAFTATTLRYQVSVSDSNPFNLPAGFEAQTWQIEVEGTVAVQSVTVATSMQELARV